MPSVYDLKPAFQNLLRPLVTRLARIGITANQVTIAALLLSIAVGLCIAVSETAVWSLWLIPLTLFLRMALNAIDGMLAREHNMKTPLGAVLNELGDVLSDAALYLPFAVHPLLQPAVVVLFVVGAVISEMTGVVAVQIGAARRYDGPMGKSDRALAMSVLAVAMACGLPSIPARGMLLLFTLLLLPTIWRRAARALAEISTCPST